MADQKRTKVAGPKEEPIEGPGSGVTPNPDAFRQIVDDVVDSESGDDAKAYVKAIKADTAAEEARAHAEIVKGTPAERTPSGHALVEAAGTSDDARRAERYADAKSARRWGHG